MSLIETLGNGTRLEILRELSREPKYVSELAEATGMDGKTAVHHLSTLEEAGLVEWYMRGNRKYYALTASVELRIAPPPERRFVLQTTDVDVEPADDHGGR
ncbi:transcriptional regulator [Natronococcus pandeyae]|uniref:Transcriptional regulator n=1 Tax=Natronococcus pandeyae TaxID=2055836 RepID=A0A8J8Q6S8_9EURY|nr:winged helix-turn-helix domain-containing protein [Natronococcus pandeyae]TYL40142.1 transcriptional regulator [Natronococcus pandeyae]